MKKLIAALLCALVCTALFSAALADGTGSYGEYAAAQLEQLGLFQGTDAGAELERTPTRTEALVMLIRALGKEDEALAYTGSHPFGDVPQWADRYVAYAYNNGLASGVSAAEFGTGDASAQAYVTFTLRALGYSEDAGDFTWSDPWQAAKSAGILPGCVDTESFTRADAAIITWSALSAEIKGGGQTLADSLIAAGVFTEAEYADRAEMDAGAVHDLCSPAIFTIRVYSSAGTASASASGFFINSEGVAVVNYHSINGCWSAAVRPYGSDTYYDVLGVYDWDEDEDWAIIQVDITANDYIEMSTDELSAGQTVYNIGSALTLEDSMSAGIISNPQRSYGGQLVIQTTASISSGSSGSPLLDVYGRAVGFCKGHSSSGNDIYFFVPVSSIADWESGEMTTLPEMFFADAVEITGYQTLRYVPDFGAWAGVEPLAGDADEGVWYYALSELPEGAASGYMALLCDWGLAPVYYGAEDGCFSATFSGSNAFSSFYCAVYTPVTVSGEECLCVYVGAQTASSAPHYEDSTVPDFGAYLGVECVEAAYADENTRCYTYELASLSDYANIDTCLTFYDGALSESGFSLSSSYVTATSEFMLYENTSRGICVDVSVNYTEGLLNVVIR